MNFTKTSNGNILAYLTKKENTEEVLKELKANTTDGALEKHVPVVEVKGKDVLVKVGEVAHPMTEEHYITWIVLETETGFMVEFLKPNQKPEATFKLSNSKPLRVFEYCNLHGLWVKEL